MRGQATDHYYSECAILQLQIFGIWKSSPATPKTGVWQKPVLAVGNWSRPIISQSAREREKKELSVDQAKEQGWEWAHIPQKVFFYFCSDDFIRWGTLSQYIFNGPESDHWECLSLTHSLTHWLTHCCLVNLIDVTLRCEYGNSKLVEVFTVADVDAEDHVGNSLLIWVIKLNFCSDFEHKGWSGFRRWNLFSILPLMFCRGYEVESWTRFWG